MQNFLLPTDSIDSENNLVKEFVEQQITQSQIAIEKVIALYYAVRDGFYYDPYKLDLTVKGLSASHTISLGYGWCVSKSILLAACCRAIGVPSRLGFADVKNHLSTKRLRETMKTDVFYWHGYTSIYLEGKWVKATPAFNKALCDKFAIKTLEFDGLSDSIYHPFNMKGEAHMEYLNQRGEFSDLPLQQILKTYAQEYDNMSQILDSSVDFNNDVASEQKHS